jgi:hypothetical protein
MLKKYKHDVEKRVLGNLGRKPILLPEFENELVKLHLNMKKKLFLFADKGYLSVQHSTWRSVTITLPFLKNIRMPWKEVACNFSRRKHPHLALRKPQAASFSE